MKWNLYMYLAVTVVFPKNSCGTVNAVETSFFHRIFKLLEHGVGEDAADNHVAITKVLDELLKQRAIGAGRDTI